MDAVRKRSLGRSRRIVLCLLSAAALAFTFTPLASAQAVDVGGSAVGTGFFDFGEGGPSSITVDVTGTPQAATGFVAVTLAGSPFSDTFTFTGEPRCIAIDETATGFSASIAGEITGGPAFLLGKRGFQFVLFDNTPTGQPDQVNETPFAVDDVPLTSCAFNRSPGSEVTGDYVITPAGACPPGEDEDNDGLTDERESLFSTLLDNPDSDLDGIADGNDDANGNGEDDEDEDDDEDDGCPDEDSDDDGEDDEDEDDQDDDD